MKESRQSRAPRERKSHLSADAERLVTCALGMANSGSRVEDRFWDRELAARLQRMLDNGHSQAIIEALERLNQTDPEAYGALIETVEENAESLVVEHAGRSWQVLLVVAPLVAWTRFTIPSGEIPVESRNALAALLREHVLAPDAHLYLTRVLYSMDQLPRDFAELRALTRRAGAVALNGKPEMPVPRNLPESAEMLADARYLLGAVAVPADEPAFRWQSVDLREQGGRVQVLERWIEHARPIVEQLVPGCGFECLLPDAYHINMRESDRRVRPYGIRAAVHYLTHALNIDAHQIRAIVAGFGHERIDEYRIGLSVDGTGEDIAHGVVWPLLGTESEDDEPAPIERIRECLRETGITDVREWSEVSEPEFCEDCGVPLYPNDRAEMVHAEMPNDVAPESVHFH